MDSSDSLKLDENLARFLAAYDQGIDGGDADAHTVQVPAPAPPPSAPAEERQVTPLHGSNQGSLGEVLPDPDRPARARPQPSGYGSALPPGGQHRIGRFELRRQLGKGGCGIVFLAYDPKLEREVALKIPRPEMLLNPDAKRRLMREAQAAAEFDHPNLVPVFETGEIGPVCYIATAFCPGQTLADWLDRQAFPVPVRQAARLVATVAEAVQHAHDRGVLHRDLKPNNIILQELKVEENDEPPPGSVLLRGEHLLPRVVDFGLAKLLERGGPSETGTRQILGTPKYMAPEQAQARHEDIGPPADVYALGVILYEMITGRAPYEGASDVEVLRQSVEGKPPPPRTFRPDVPRDLEAICLKAMARTTTARYRTAIDLADDLRRFLDGRPTIARPLAWSGRAVRWLRRNDQIVAIVVLGVTVLFVTFLASWSTYLSRQLRKDRDSALNEQANQNRAGREREYSQHIRDAFNAWRSGNLKAAEASLDAAKRAGSGLMESPDFTHDYLARRLKAERLMIVCPAGSVTALAVSPDGNRLASGHADGTLAVWDRDTGTQIGSVNAHESAITHVAFALGGTMLVTAGRSKDATADAVAWSVAKAGTLTPASEPHRVIGKNITCLAVSPDGKSVYLGGPQGALARVHLIDPKQSLSRPGTADGAGIAAIAVSPNGNVILTASSTTVRRWNANLTPTPTRSEFTFAEPVTALAVVYGELPVVGFAGGGVLLMPPVCQSWGFDTGSRVQWLATATDNTFAIGGTSGRIHIGPRTEIPTGDTGPIQAGTYSPDGQTLFTGSRDGIIRSLNTLRDSRDPGTLAVGHVVTVGVSSTGEYVGVADRHHATRYDRDGEAKFVECGPRPLVAARVFLDGSIRGVSLDRRVAVVADLSGNTSTERLRVAMQDNRPAASASLNADGTFVAVGDDSGRVSVWSVAERELKGTLDTGLRRPVRGIAFSHDSRHVAVPMAGGIGVWAVGTAEVVVAIPTDEQAAFCFLPTGERIATAGRDGAVRVWTLAGKEEMTLFGHVGRVTGLGVSPDGRNIVSGGATGEVKFWDVRTGQELLSLRRHSTPVTAIEFSADGKFLVTGGEGQLAIWDARSE